MSKPLSQDELGEDLCNYCDIDENEKGVHGTPDGPVMCCDSGMCDVAYDNYLERYEEEE